MKENVIEGMDNKDMYNDNIENIRIIDSPKSDNIKNLLILLTILILILTISIFITKFILNDKETNITNIEQFKLNEENHDLNIQEGIELNQEKIKIEKKEVINSILEERKEKNIEKKIVTNILFNKKENNKAIINNSFYIKIASLTEEPSEKYLSRIKKVGFSYKLIRLQKDNKPLIRILIGPFLSKKSANNNLNFIQKRFSKSAYITKI